ncbi:hypothetical protein OPU71_08880 [Niveibacterium sp. 24ML]|nr:hypothetical protein [Niveibacterium sp. 24ML]
MQGRQVLLGALVTTALLVIAFAVWWIATPSLRSEAPARGPVSSLFRSMIPKALANNFGIPGDEVTISSEGADAQARLVDALLHGRFEEADRIAKAIIENGQFGNHEKQAVFHAALEGLKGRGKEQARILDYLSMLAPSSLTNDLVGELLNAFGSSELRAAAARTLGAAFIDPSPDGADQTPMARARNAAILDALRAGIASSDQNVAVSSLMTFSRIGPTEEVTAALLKIQARNWIDRTAAVRELLIQMPAANSAKEQVSLAKTIVRLSEGATPGELRPDELVFTTSQSISGSDIVIARISPDARQIIAAHMIKLEPPIADASGTVTPANARGYAEWLKLTTELTSSGIAEANKRAFAALQAADDPRRVVAVLAAISGPGFAGAVSPDELKWLRGQVERAARESHAAPLQAGMVQTATEAIAAAERERHLQP